MGQLVLTVVGGAIGSLFGMPQLGMIVGGMIGGAIFGSSTAGGPRLEDKTVSASTYGVAIPRIYGSVRLASNLIWTAGIKEHEHGGKGMGSGQKSYTYDCSFAVAFCVGEVDEILRIWGDTKLIFGASDMNKLRDAFKNGADFGTLLGTYMLGKKKKKYTIRIYKGSEDQLPDAAIVANKGADSTPAYRGLVYAVFENFPLTDFGNRIPNISAEITRSKSTTLPTLTFENLDGSVPYMPNAYYDWDGNRVVNVEGGFFKVYSMRTMRQIAQFPVPDHTAKIGFTPGGGPVVVQVGSSNARVCLLLDGQTFQPYDQLGHISNNLGEYPFEACTGAPDDHGATAYLVANGYFHCFRVRQKNGYRNFWCNFNGFGGVTCWDFDSNFVNFLNSGNALTLGEFEGRTELAVWNGDGSGGIILDKYSFSSGDKATMGYVDCPTWECDRGYKVTILSVPDNHKGTYNIAPPKGGSVQNLVYNTVDDTILFTCFNGHPYIAIWSVTDETFIRVFDLPGTTQIEGLTQSRLTGYKLGYGRYSDSNIVTIDLNTGDYTETPYPNAYILYAGNVIWDDSSQSIYFPYLGNGYHWVRVFAQTVPTEVTVGGIVSEVLADTGQLQPSDYDVSALMDIPVMGYTIGRESSARDIIQQLGGAYFFDGVESDYKIKFVKRGGASKVTIYEDQMGNLSDKDIQLRETLAQETEAPYRVTINYMDQDRDYQTASQFAKRISNPFPTMNTRREDKAELPIVLTADTAKQMADKALKAAWVGRISNEAMLPWKFLKYDPTDVVTYIMNDGSSRLSRMVKMDVGEDLTIKAAGVNDSAVAYVSVLKGDSGSVPPQYAADPAPAELVVLNTPLLRDLDDTQGVGSNIYLSAVTPTGPFGGAYLQKAEPGSDFEAAGTVVKQPHAGYVLNKLEATHSWASMDTTTALKVVLYDPTQTLASISYDELMAGKNMCVVGKEVIQYQNAEVDDNGYWTLTNILRARRGTDWAVADHMLGEQFIMVAEDGSVVVNTRSSTDEDHEERIRAVVSGETVDDSVGLTYEIDPNDLRPYSVQNVRVEDLDNGFKISFDRRSRITNTITDFTGTTSYREGDTATGNYAYRVWHTVTPTGKPWKNISDGTLLRNGTVPVLVTGDGGSVSVNENPAISLNDLFPPTAGTACIVEIIHNGFVAGFPSYRYFQREEDGTWTVTELYP